MSSPSISWFGCSGSLYVFGWLNRQCGALSVPSSCGKCVYRKDTPIEANLHCLGGFVFSMWLISCSHLSTNWDEALGVDS